jgi:esterase/lipase superfamily enzyme
LNFAGVTAFYSWPSNGRTSAYTWDEQSAERAIPHLKHFLEILAKAGLRTIHVIAHSMGNRSLTRALQGGLDLGDCILDQCVLAAPDIDAEVFKQEIAPAIALRVGRLTLYASARDRALRASQAIHRYPRAGDAGPQIIVLEDGSMESVDASMLETDYLGHSYYGDNVHLIADLRQILEERKSAAYRRWMRPVPISSSLRYWEFRPESSKSQ